MIFLLFGHRNENLSRMFFRWWSLLLVSSALAVLVGCAKLPVVENKPVELAKPAPASGPLVTASRQLAKKRTAGESSFLLLSDAGEALKWRLALIDSASSSIDIQLYLWHSGTSSALLFERALQAADRGVRVRLLVDDFLLTANDTGIATLSRNHPNFEIRIFNPSRVRGGGLGGISEFISNFRELNRRMHNKTFTADRCMTIVGGRNVGDHYFGMDKKYNFIDLDVLATGPVVADVSDGFDEFWNSAGAYPGAMLSSKEKPELVVKARARFREIIASERDGKLRDYPGQRADWSSELSALNRDMVTGTAQFLQDHPDPNKDTRVVVKTLTQMTDHHEGEVQFVTPYLIPSTSGVEAVAEATAAGAEVRVLVPTLSANNQPIVDGHYKKYREPLLKAGTILSEFRPDPTEEIRALADVGPVHCERVTLHLKAVVGDRSRCFIGSLNLDPRALKINTESGMLIESPALAGQLADYIDTLSNDQNSWKVSHDSEGKIQWQSRGETRRRPPPAKWSSRVISWFSGLLPIKSQI